MLTITWVTFLFAPGLPILFPIALIGITVLYVTDRLAIAYWCKKPPTYDTNISDATIQLIRFAPVMYVTMGGWLYSN